MRVAILTASDSRSAATDISGQLVKVLIEALPDVEVIETQVVPDEQAQISAQLVRCADELGCDLVLTTGGTGVAPRDVTPEATMAVCDRLIPGLGEAMRAGSLSKTPMAMLSRGISGIRGRCLIVNLPGSPKGARECLEIVMPVLPHAVELAGGGAPH